jgi:hypothetical protein
MIDDQNGGGFPTERGECTRLRLAESGLAAVDLCSCGTLQVHIGALTLRLDEVALSELTATFGRALTQNALRPKLARDGATLRVFQPGKPGEA